MSKFTPGPWDIFVTEGKSGKVAYEILQQKSKQERWGNSKILKTAPDTITVCREVRAFLARSIEDTQDIVTWLKVFHDKVDEALKKAIE